MLIETVKPTNC